MTDLLHIDIPRQGPTTVAALDVKSQDSPERYLDATVSLIEGSGTKGAKPRPFRQDLAVRAFRSWVYVAAMVNAQAFAAVPLRLYVRRRPGRTKLFRTAPVPKRRLKYLAGGHDDHRVAPSRGVVAKVAEFGQEFEEVTETHPALDVLAGANPWQNGYELAVLRSLYWQITGNAYVHPVLDPALGVPSELWVMPSQWTKVIPSRDAFIAGYVYGRTSAEELTFAPDEVIQWKLPNLTDVYYGMGRAEAAWTALGLHDARRTLDQAKLDNHARPDWLLAIEGATPESLKRVEDKVDARLKGVRNGGRFLAVNGKVTATALQFEMPEIGTDDKIVQEIAAVFGTPLYKLQGNDPIKANSETQDTGWLRDTILPYCRMDEEQLNARYLPLFGIEGDAFLAYDNPVKDDESKTVERITKYVAGGIMTPNEGRAEIGDAPVAGGDVLLVPSNVTPIDRLGQNADLLAGLLAGSRMGGNGGGSADPAPPASDPAAAPGAAQDIQTTQATVLNGAQVTSATAIVMSVTAGGLPRDAGLGMLQAFFNLTPEKAEQVMGSAGNPKVPTTPNPVPVAEPKKSPTTPSPSMDGTEGAGGKSRKTAGPHEYSCVMAPIAGATADIMLAFGNAIPDEDLVGDGRETDTHVTVLYGLHTDTAADVVAVLKGESPATMTLGRTAVFPANEHRDSDVIVVEVDSADLFRLNGKLAGLDHTNNYREYKPHATIAYVKAGMGQKYADKYVGRGILTHTADHVVFSSTEGTRTNIPLGADAPDDDAGNETEGN